MKKLKEYSIQDETSSVKEPEVEYRTSILICQEPKLLNMECR